MPANASLDDKVNCYDDMVGYDELEPLEEFIYISRVPNVEWKAFKINDKFAALVNRYDKYILAKRYSNCLSIGDGNIVEYATLDQAIQASKRSHL